MFFIAIVTVYGFHLSRIQVRLPYEILQRVLEAHSKSFLNSLCVDHFCPKTLRARAVLVGFRCRAAQRQSHLFDGEKLCSKISAELVLSRKSVTLFETPQTILSK